MLSFSRNSQKNGKTMKYTVETFGRLCHYQFSNINELDVNNIEIRELDSFEVEQNYLLDKCNLENQKISLDHEIRLEIIDDSNVKVIEFNIDNIDGNIEDFITFFPQPQQNKKYENCLGSINYYIGGGPIFEFETNENLKIDDFSFSMIVFDLDDDEITLMNELYFKKIKLRNIDIGDSRGKNGFVKIWKKNGEVLQIL